VENAARVGKRNRITNAQKNPQTIGNGCNRFDIFVEALAFDEFHGVKNTAVWERPDVVNGDDAGMFEGCEHACFTDKTVGEIAVGARTIDDLWKAIGNICDLYTPEECWAYLKQAGYASD